MSEAFSGASLSLGGPALGEKYVPGSQWTLNMGAALIQKLATLVLNDIVLVCSASCRFSKGSGAPYT